jgi:hypothetical protein
MVQLLTTYFIKLSNHKENDVWYKLLKPNGNSKKAFATSYYLLLKCTIGPLGKISPLNDLD